MTAWHMDVPDLSGTALLFIHTLLYYNINSFLKEILSFLSVVILMKFTPWWRIFMYYEVSAISVMFHVKKSNIF